jgi:signal transduction histidine kinase/ligand-binding sensor domain-containing protein
MSHSMNLKSNRTTGFLTLCTLLLTLFTAITLKAQVNASMGIPTITNYPVGDYIAAGQQVWTINQDRNGFMYVGTGSGLLKYDGKNWELLLSPNTGFNLNVRATHLAESGILYYGSLGDFGYITEDHIGNTIQVSLAHLIPENLLFNDIWSIKELGEKIYFQSREAIFIYTHGKEDRVPAIDIWKPDTQFMYSFYLDGVYYAHQINLGLYREKDGGLQLIPGSEFLGENRVQVMLPYQEPGHFLVGAFSGGLFHYDGTNFRPFETEIDYLFQDRSLYEGLALPDNKYALGVLGYGLYIIDQNGRILSEFNRRNSISDDSVYSLFLDKTDNLWVGTNNGLSKIEIFSPLTRFSSDEYEIGNVLSLNMLNNKLYIGTSTNVLYIDDIDGRIKQVEGIPNSQVFDLEADGNQLLSSNSGLYRIVDEVGQLISGTERIQIINILISKKHPGYLFLGGAEGISVLKRLTMNQNEDQYEFIGQISQIERYIYTVAEDSEGEIWGGTQAGSLFRIRIPKTASGNLDIFNPSVQEFTANDGIRGLSGLASGINGKIYTSGVNGFYFFDKQSNTFIRDSVFSFSDDIANINLDTFSIGADKLGQVLIDFKSERRVAIPASDGSYTLQEYPLNLFTGRVITNFYTEPDGVFWLGTDEGLLRIDPNVQFDTQFDVPIYLTRVMSSADTLGHKAHVPGSEIPEIQFQNNSISFSYVAPFFIKENLIRYQTYLEGYDQGWSRWDDNTFREFTNLPYGKYIFRVKARNIFNTDSDEITYSFVILPPWYATWWAYIFYFLGFSVFVFGLVKVQTRRILAREKKKTMEKELQQAREIETAYQNLKVAQDQLVQQEKLASLGQLTAGIAHEIKNPLNFVNNFSEVSLELVDEVREEVRRGTEDGGPGSEKAQLRQGFDEQAKVKSEKSPFDLPSEASAKGGGGAEAIAEVGDVTISANDETTSLILEILDDIEANLRKIHEHGSRADGIVKSMLQHSRGGSGKMEPTNLNSIIKEYVNLAFHGMRAGKEAINVNIDLQLDESVGDVPLIGEDFSRVILNLTNNAFDAMREKLTGEGRPGTGEKSPFDVPSEASAKGGGSGEVERSRGVSSSHGYHPKLTVRTKSDNGKVTIEIEDNGLGIPEEIKDKILQPFFTTKKGTQGTGLGLSITNDIVKAHGGVLSIASQEGKGTTFSIELPIV